MTTADGTGAVDAESAPVMRPWGSFVSIHRGARHLVKRICVAPGARLSLQFHHHRSEHWVVVAGTALVTRGETTERLEENAVAYIERGMVHRLENIGRDWLEVIEVQFGDRLEEDDIVRLEDDYRRV